MNTVVNSEPRIVAIEVTEDTITAQLADGRTIYQRAAGVVMALIRCDA